MEARNANSCSDYFNIAGPLTFTWTLGWRWHVIDFKDVLIFFHIILFVYWLGADLGVYYASKFVVKPELSIDARGMAAKIMEFVDLSPRVAIVLFLPS